MIRSALLNVMTAAARKAGRSLKRDFGEVENLQVSEKGPGDFVSHADIKAERGASERRSGPAPSGRGRRAQRGDRRTNGLWEGDRWEGPRFYLSLGTISPWSVPCSCRLRY